MRALPGFHLSPTPLRPSSFRRKVIVGARHPTGAVGFLLILSSLLTAPVLGQTRGAVASPERDVRAPTVTTPRQFFGHEIGADYELPNYTQLEAYWRLLAGESDRMIVEEIGRTSEGRPQLMAIVTSPANHADLARYRRISQRLALAEGVREDEAQNGE